MRACGADREAWNSLQPQPDTLYVVLPQAKRARWRLEQQGASCASFAYGAACSTSAAAIDEAVRAGTLTRSAPTPPALACNQHIELATASTTDFLLDGWSFAEGWGRWARGDSAGLYFQLAPASCRPTQVALRASAALCRRRPSVDISVSLQGALLGTLHFDRGANSHDTVRTLAIPPSVDLSGPRLVLELRASDHRSPREVGCGDDERPLALAVRDLWLQ